VAVIAERVFKWSGDRAFYTSMAIVLAAAVFLGFAPTFFLRGYLPLPPGANSLSSLIVIHGLLNTLWFALFLVQTLLVARARTDIHRRLGMSGAALAIAIVLVGTLTTIKGLRDSPVTPQFDGRVFFLGATLPSFVLFGALVAAAIVFRRRPETHKRLMLLATIKLMSAGLDRIFSFNFAGPVPDFLVHTQMATDIFIIAAVLYDLRTRGRLHPALVWGGAAIVLQPLLLVVARTHAALALSDHFR
jgi:hypothetical protein